MVDSLCKPMSIEIISFYATTIFTRTYIYIYYFLFIASKVT